MRRLKTAGLRSTNEPSEVRVQPAAPISTAMPTAVIERLDGLTIASIFSAARSTSIPPRRSRRAIREQAVCRLQLDLNVAGERYGIHLM